MAKSDGLDGVALGDAAPIGAGERILSLDVLRGVAVLGILLMNITAFGLPWPAYFNPPTWGGSTGANLWAWITTEMFFEGTMRTIFSMLFGAGVVVFTTRAEKKDPTSSADLFYRRTILLIFFGVIHGYVMLWVGDILYAYGIAGLFLFPLRKLTGRRLVTLGLLVLVVSGTMYAWSKQSKYHEIKDAWVEAVALQQSGAALTDDQESALRAWVEMQDDLDPNPEEVQRRIERNREGYLTTFSKMAPVNQYIQTTELYTGMFWDVISMMLIGMGLFKMGVVTGERSTKAYGAMVVVGYAVGLTVNALETRYIIASEFNSEAITEMGWTYNIGRLFVSMGHIGLVMLLVRLGALAWLMKALAAVGRMALTNYLMQTVICNTVFLGFGFGLFGSLDRWELYIVVGGVWLAQLIWSPLWLSIFRFGPAEWLWRWMTYGKTPAMLRAAR